MNILNDFFCTRNVSRGCRNNNPLNIRRSNSAWLGKIPFRYSSDSQFEQFEDISCGIRAAAKLLYRYIKVYKLQSVYSIIRRWAPASDGNNVDSYINSVTEYLIKVNINPYYVHSDVSTISHLIVAMAKVESGLFMDYERVYTYLRKTKLY